MARHPPALLGAVCIFFLIAIAALVWWYMARRWWSVQHAKFCRMRHIEERLGVAYQVQYLDYLDGRLSPHCREGDPRRNPGQLRQRFLPTHLTWDQQQDLECLLDNHQRTGVQRVLKCGGLAYLAIVLLCLVCQSLWG